MKFAVIYTGGKQYKVVEGESVKIERLTGDFKIGDAIMFDKVLLTSDGTNAVVGTPHIENATVKATLESIGRNQKVNVIKFKQKSKSFKKNGHRQDFFQVKVTSL